eukprot:1018623-Rhodomonas_salina.1
MLPGHSSCALGCRRCRQLAPAPSSGPTPTSYGPPRSGWAGGTSAPTGGSRRSSGATQSADGT